MLLDSSDAKLGVLRSQLDTATTRQVTTRTHVPDAFSSPNKQIMSRVSHIARGSLVGKYRLKLPNFYVPSGNVEAGSGAVASITASIEYLGALTPVTFSGSGVGSIPNNGMLESDDIALNIPNGATFYVRTWFSGSAGIVYSNDVLAASDDAAAFGATTPDLTGSTGTAGMSTGTGTATMAMYSPCAIIGLSSLPAVYIVGDSIAKGQSDAGIDAFKNQGWLERLFGPRFAFINVSKGSTLASQMGGVTNRSLLATYCQYAFLGSGINDLTGAKTPAQILTAYAAIAAFYPTTKNYLCTILPNTTDSNAWKSTAAQVVQSFEVSRISVNTSIRSLAVAGFSGFLDPAASVETASTTVQVPSLNGGLWIPLSAGLAAMTADGLHPAAAGAQFLANNNFAALSLVA